MLHNHMHLMKTWQTLVDKCLHTYSSLNKNMVGLEVGIISQVDLLMQYFPYLYKDSNSKYLLELLQKLNELIHYYVPSTQ